MDVFRTATSAPIRSRRAHVTIITMLAALMAWAGPAVTPATAAPASGTVDIGAYQGLGAWIDIFDPAAWKQPAATVRDLKAHGVRTIYIETGNSSQRVDLYKSRVLARYIARAHAAHMRVVAWYLPTLTRPKRDLRRSVAAIDLRTPTGDSFDSFALDIESSAVRGADARNRRLLALSTKLRAHAGAAYPLGAIIPSPAGMRAHRQYWPGFPYAGLDAVYDVFLPMVYTSYHVDGAQKAYDETARSIRLLRSGVGRTSVPVHVIGGLADELDRSETRAAVRASREYGAIGVSLYDAHTTGPGDWRELANVDVVPRQTVAMPMAPPAVGQFGNIAGTDVEHPRDLFLKLKASATPVTLSFDAFSIESGEVAVMVNWKIVARVAATAPGAWSVAPQQIVIPAESLSATRTNSIGFVALGAFPTWSTWGVGNITVS